MIKTLKSKAFTPELNYIKNEKIRKNAEIILDLLPDYFYEIPASSTGKYHPEFSLGKAGLLRHTKVAVRIAKEILDLEFSSEGFTNDEKDLMIFTLLIHDGLKSGMEYNEYTKFDHPIIISKFIKENKNKTTFTDKEINFIVTGLESHMGEWNTNNYSEVILPKPKSKHQNFIHMCDYLASRKFLDIKFDNNDNIID